MPTQDYEFEVGSKATLSGWGALGSSQSSPDELYFNPNNEVVSDDQCQDMYNSIGLGSYFVPEVSNHSNLREMPILKQILITLG